MPINDVPESPGYTWHPVAAETRANIARLGGALRNIIEGSGDVLAVGADAVGAGIRNMIKVILAGCRGLFNARPPLHSVPPSRP